MEKQSRQKQSTRDNAVANNVTSQKKQAGISAMAAPAQFTRQSKGVEYATDDADAVTWLKANVKNWDTLPEEDREQAMNVALNKELGVTEAKKMLEADGLEAAAAARKATRTALVKDDFESFDGVFGDDLANSVFSVMRSAYISGNKNVSLGGDHTQAAVDAAIAAMTGFLEQGNLGETITNVHFFRRQNKAAAGKGRVGDTLATREIQANFIATWGGATVNVHVDING